MRTTRRTLMTASALLLAIPVTGCAMGGNRSTSLAGKVDSGQIGMALKAQAALESGDSVAAVQFAERALENSPSDAGFRSLLGNAYLSAGRFRSAEAAYGDALALAAGQAGVPLKLALVQAALGKGDAALATLETYVGQIDPADAGLAMALAGRPGAAVELLDRVAREPGADGRVRQNLALAHALGGDWVRARSIAAQDVPGDQLEARMSEWAALARPSAPGAQVAAMLGVKGAVADPGMPVRFALKATGAGVRLAEIAPQPVDASVWEPVGVAVAAAAMVEPALAAPVLAAPMPLPEVVAPIAVPAVALPVEEAAPDVAAMVDSLRREPVRVSGTLPQVSQLRRSAARRFGQSKAVVQLGAYATEAGVRMGWGVVSRRHRNLSAYVPASARFVGQGGTVYRLSLKGFASDAEARKLCMELKTSGASCFVRNAAGDSPVRFANR